MYFFPSTCLCLPLKNKNHTGLKTICSGKHCRTLVTIYKWADGTSPRPGTGREAGWIPSRALKKHGILSLWSFRCRNRGYTLSFCGTLWSRTPCDPGSDPGTPTARWRREQRSGPCAGVSGRQVPGRLGELGGPTGTVAPESV